MLIHAPYLLISVKMTNLFSSHRFKMGSPIAADTMPLRNHAPFCQMANPLPESPLHGPFTVVDAAQNIRFDLFAVESVNFLFTVVVDDGRHKFVATIGICNLCGTLKMIFSFGFPHPTSVPVKPTMSLMSDDAAAGHKHIGLINALNSMNFLVIKMATSES